MNDERTELQRLREQNARLKNRVQRLKARAGETDLSYLFVVTYGRSGSTLVSGLLNSIPGYLIRGENRDALRHLYGFHQLMKLNARGPKANFRATTHPFYGAGDFPEPRSIDSIRRLVLDTVLRPQADTRVTGFKEIRWVSADMHEYIEWLRVVFPGARFIINTRNLDDVLASNWWADGDPAEARAYLTEFEAAIVALADQLGPAAYRIHYDDYVADPTILRGLYDWLGEPFNADAVRAVFDVKHSI